MKPIDIKERFIELRAQGLSFDTISKELGVSKQTLINWSKDFQEEIENLKTAHLEALQEKYRLSREKRLEMFAKKLEAIENELKKRDLSEVPTQKLLELYLKYHTAAKAEIVDSSYLSESEIENRKSRRVFEESIGFY